MNGSIINELTLSRPTVGSFSLLWATPRKLCFLHDTVLYCSGADRVARGGRAEALCRRAPQL